MSRNYLNELLFKAFEISSLIWLFHKREDMLNFFCEKVSELRNCVGVVLKDTTGIYGKISGDLVNCVYLNWEPKTIEIIPTEKCNCRAKYNHDYLLIYPHSQVTVYIFIKGTPCEITLQILKEIIFVLSRALDNLEAKINLEVAINQLKSNLEYFYYLSDRLRNPLTGILVATELKEEIETEKAFKIIRDCGLRIKEIVDEMEHLEVSTRRTLDSGKKILLLWSSPSHHSDNF